MKAEVVIPKGWEKVRGRLWMKGDRYLRKSYLTWHVIESHLVGEFIDGWEVAIRKVKKARTR
jgi:hypothetical protein